MDRASRALRGVAAALFALVPSMAAPAVVAESIRLEDAIARAIEARPELVAADAERRALEAAVLQAARCRIRSSRSKSRTSREAATSAA